MNYIVSNRKTKRSNAFFRNMMFLLAALVFMLTLSLNYTAAWFTDSAYHIAYFQFGKVELDLEVLGENEGMLNIEKEDLMPGNIIDRTLRIGVPETAEPVYLRMRTAFLMDDGSGFEEYLYVVSQFEIEEASNWDVGKNRVDGPDSSFWYYYKNTLNTGNSIDVPISLFVYPVSLSGSSGFGNKDSGNNYKIHVYVESVQMANDGYVMWESDHPDGWPSNN